MNCEKISILKSLHKKILISFVLLFSTPYKTLLAQNYDLQSAAYNTIIGGIAGGFGAILNKKQNEKWHKVFIKNLFIGSAGGAIMYCGKRTNYLIGYKNELGYGWISRTIYNVGNSIVENAASNRDFWAVWHYDMGFIRLEYETQTKRFRPQLMPSSFLGMLYLTTTSKFDTEKSLRSGTPIFYRPIINKDTLIAAQTTSNGFVYRSAFKDPNLYHNIGHEIIHTFQLQDFSSYNILLNPITERWKTKSPRYKKINEYIYWDLNYEIMAFNYYFLFGGNNGHSYYSNFLENEAEYLSSNKKL